MGTRLEDNEYLIRSGDLKTGFWRLSKETLSNGEIAIKLNKIVSCQIVKDEHSFTQSGSGQIAGGIIGATLLGPIGALGGLLSGGKKRVDETIIHCGLEDNRSFTAESTQIGAANLIRIAQQNVRTTINNSHNASTLDSSTGDQMECPQCAELIKKRAKICRYCGANLIEINSPDIGVTNSEDFGLISSESYRKFLTDYRMQVKDSPFRTDQSIIDIIIEVGKKERAEPYSNSKAKKNIAKKFDIPILEIDKIFTTLWHMQNLVDAYIKRNPFDSAFGDLSREHIAYLIKTVIDKPYSTSEENREAIANEFTDKTEKIITKGYVARLMTGFPLSFGIKPLYIVDNYVLAIDEETRKKKPKMKTGHKLSANPIADEILKSDEFVQWFDEQFENFDIAPDGVVKIFCGWREVSKLDGENDSYIHLGNSLVFDWDEDENRGLDSPDKWLESKLQQELINYNEDVDDGRLEDNVLISVFKKGFSGLKG